MHNSIIKKQKTCGIKQVAKLAEVSISTVSRVINKSKPVREETKRRVIEAIEELNYHPNEVARSLVTKKTNLFGLVVDDINCHCSSEIIKGVEDGAQENEYDILFLNSSNNIEVEKRFIRKLKNRQAEGLILINRSKSDRLIKYVEELNIPYIYINDFYGLKENYLNKLDYQTSAYSLSKYIIGNNHKNIIFVHDGLEEYSFNKLKLEGFKQALEEFSLGLNIFQVKKDNLDDLLEETFAKKASCLLCTDDGLALDISNYCYDRGIMVPKSLSIAGYGGKIKLDKIRPRLTTVILPYYEIGLNSFLNLLEKINRKKEDTKKNILDYKIEERYTNDYLSTYKLFKGSSVIKLK